LKVCKLFKTLNVKFFIVRLFSCSLQVSSDTVLQFLATLCQNLGTIALKFELEAFHKKNFRRSGISLKPIEKLHPLWFSLRKSACGSGDIVTAYLPQQSCFDAVCVVSLVDCWWEPCYGFVDSIWKTYLGRFIAFLSP